MRLLALTLVSVVVIGWSVDQAAAFGRNVPEDRYHRTEQPPHDAKYGAQRYIQTYSNPSHEYFYPPEQFERQYCGYNDYNYLRLKRRHDDYEESWLHAPAHPCWRRRPEYKDRRWFR